MFETETCCNNIIVKIL